MGKIVVLGLGYIGLPLSLQFARSGALVTGIDIDPEKVETLNAGKTYIKHVPDGAIEEALAGRRKHCFLRTKMHMLALGDLFTGGK